MDRFPCLVGGERSGKSTAAEKMVLPPVLALPYARPDRFFYDDGRPRFDPKSSKPRNPDFALFGPNYKEPRIEFEYLENDLRALGKLLEAHTSKPSDGAWRMVTTDGVVIVTISLEHPESVRSIDLEGAMVCEAGGCKYAGIERVRGRVAAKRGFVIYVGTIEESQSWWKDWLLEGKRANNKGIITYTIPSWVNSSEFPGGINDPEIVSWRAFLGEDLFMERCAAVPRPPRFRVLKEVTETHIRRVDVPDDAIREIWIDPGYASAYAIVFVAIWQEGENKRFHFYDELYEQGLNTEAMIALCKAHWSWGSIQTGVIDIASKGHRDATESALEIWEKRTSVRFKKKYWLEDRLIERVRNSAINNQISIDPNCKGFIAECGLGEPVFPEMHPWRYVVDKDGRIISEKPLDRWNHSGKAIGYGLLSHLGQVEWTKKPTSFNRLNKKAAGVAEQWETKK